MSGILVVGRTCPGCGIESHWPDDSFQLRVRDLEYSHGNDFEGVVLCDACNLVSSRTAPISHPRSYDPDRPPPGIFCENVFLLTLRCSDRNCDTRIQILAPKPSSHRSASAVWRERRKWKFAEEVFCPNGHPLMP